MQEGVHRSAVRRSIGAALSRAWVLFALAAITIGGCPSSSPVARVRNASSPTDVGEFRLIRQNRRRASQQQLLREALAGVVTGEETALDARMQVRSIRMPHPPRGATSRFNFGDGKRGWVTALPSEQLLASPAFANGKVFLGGGFASHQFYAFDAYDGELEWSMAAPDGGPTAAIIEDDKVIFNTESCTIFVADANTGELAWSRWLGDPLMSQPAAADGLVFSAYPTEAGHKFGAFRLTNGEPVWQTLIAADVIAAPQVAGDSVFFATMDGTAYRVHARTGRVLWQRDVGATSALWIDRDSVLLTRRIGTQRAPREQLVTLNARDGRIRHEGEHFAAQYLTGQSRDRELVSGQNGAWGSVMGAHLGLANVAAGWGFQGSTPAVADGRAYFAVAGEILARDMQTAETVWRRRYARADNAQALSPPAVVGSLLVFGTVDGQLFATDIDTGMTVWAYDIGEPVVFQPIVAQGWVYVATGRGNVVGLEVGDALLDGWHMWGGNASHTGLVETAGQIDPHLLASLVRPTRGTMRALAVTQSEERTRERTEREPAAPERELPLKGTEVDARVSGRVAEVSVTQRFQNDGTSPIEAVYLFPLPADAAVDRMEMRIGTRIVRGVIRERQEARRTYEAARSEGRRAALLEQQRENLFAQRVANIQPGDRIEVRLRYVQTLPFEEGRYELAFPMVAPRRYDPARTTETAVNAASVRIDEQPPLSLRVALDAGMPITAIASPSHPEATIEHSRPPRANVQLSATGEARARDFVLRYRLGGEHPQASVLAHREGNDGYFTLLVQPPRAPAAASIVPRDVTFVLDTSSSMHGRPLEHARAVIRRTIESMNERDRFNVIGFSDRVVSMAEAPVQRDRASIERAGTFIDELRATGATEMVPAIERALGGRTDASRLSIVVLLSDGYIGNEADVLRALATRLGDHRFYAFGVGSSVNRFLVERAAEIGRGRAIVASLSEDPRAAADRFVSFIDRPVFTDVDVNWGGLAVSDVYPRHLPDLFADKPIVVHGRFARGGRATVRVRGSVNGRRYERAIDVALPERPTAGGPHASQASLWARAAVHDRMSRLYLRDDPRLIAEVTQLGLAHSIVTPWTSFVAVDQEGARPTAEGAQEDAPAQASVSPARSLPGDPEIRIPAPADARAVTIVLPFGESVAATYERSLGAWSARFLVPRDAAEGSYPIEILVTKADGELEHQRVWYTVDASAARVHLEVEGDVRPGAEITIRATQVITEADLLQVGRRREELSPERLLLLSDARRIEARAPNGTVIDLAPSGPGAWQGRFRIPADARGTMRLDVTVVDMAANVAHQTLDLEVAR